MALNKLIRYFCGYVQFSIEDGSCERLINLCSNSNIELNELIKTEEGFKANVIALDYTKVEQFAQKLNISISEIESSGVAIEAIKLKNRWGILLGILLFFMVLLASQNFIWDVQVSGNAKVSAEEILLELESIGIKKWGYIPEIDFREKKQLALLKLPELSWLSLNISGCRINVLVAERTPAPILDDTDVCDIVAAKTGQIRYMEVYNGVALKKANYTVVEGEMLVSGTYTNERGEVGYLHSDAKIIAEVQFEKELSVDLEQFSKEYTGKLKRRKYLTLLSVDMPLFIFTKLKGNYDVTKTEKPVKFLWFDTPMSIRTNEYKFYEKKLEPLTKRQAIKVLEDKIKEYELAELGDSSILNKQVSTMQNQGTVTMKISYIVEQDIAKKSAIVINNELEQQKKQP